MVQLLFRFHVQSLSVGKYYTWALLVPGPSGGYGISGPISLWGGSTLANLAGSTIVGVKGLRLLPHWRNMWLRMIYYLQAIRQLIWDFPVQELHFRPSAPTWLWLAQTS